MKRLLGQGGDIRETFYFPQKNPDPERRCSAARHQHKAAFDIARRLRPAANPWVRFQRGGADLGAQPRRRPTTHHPGGWVPCALHR